MPTGVRKVGNRWETYDKETGEHKGWSRTKSNAESSARARDAAHHGWRPTGKKRGKR